MMNPLRSMEESKPAMCLSPQEKLKSGGGLAAQRKKKTHAAGPLAGASEAKKQRLDDFVFKPELDLDLDGWISDDNLRAMDFDDRLNQDIDWVAHDEIDLSLGLDFAQEHGLGAGGDDVNDFGFGPSSFLSPLRGGLAFEDPTEMASSFVDPMNMEPTSNAKDAEKLLMSFDTMNFTIPSPTSASSKKRGGFFGKKEPEGNVAGAKNSGGAAGSAMGECAGRAAAASSHGGLMSPSLKGTIAAASATAAELRKEQARIPTANGLTSSLSITAPADPFLGVLNIATTTPTASQQAERKIGSYSPQARKLRIQKFHEKRKNRTWKKSIKYDCRKKLADDRPRIKGRFVRVLENAGDATDDGAASPTASGGASPLGSTPAGYASPTSPTGAMAPPVMALPTAPVKRASSVHQDSMALASSLAKPMISKAVSSYGSAPTSELKRTSPALVPAPTQVPASTSARGAIARMIASV